MTLANIANRHPAYDFSHYQDHLEIAQGIAKSTGVKVAVLPLAPTVDLDQEWARRHQAMHDSMNRALKLPNSADLTKPRRDRPDKHAEWVYMNYSEHLAARTKLGI